MKENKNTEELINNDDYWTECVLEILIVARDRKCAASQILKLKHRLEKLMSKSENTAEPLSEGN